MKTIFNIVFVISVEFTIFIFSGINLDFSKPFDKFLMLDLREHLDDGSVEMG